MVTLETIMKRSNARVKQALERAMCELGTRADLFDVLARAKQILNRS